MKILVIGTSNSVIGVNGGFVETLKFQHEVYSLSSGRTPFFNHIKTILRNRTLIESCDLVIIDHYINDLNFYYPTIGESYLEKCKEFYEILSTINTRILNILFPIEDIDSGKYSMRYYSEIKKLSSYNCISCLDLNEFGFSHTHYRDSIHLKKDVSYILGLLMSQEFVLSNMGPKPTGGQLNQTPFSLLDAKDLFEKSKLKKFSNNLISFDYIDLNEELLIPGPPSRQLISLGYLRLKDMVDATGVIINGETRGLAETGYFHESLDFDATGNLHFSPVCENITCNNLMGRGVSNGPYGECLLSEFLFYDMAKSQEYKAAKRAIFDIKLPNLMDVLRRVYHSEAELSLGTKAVDCIRDLALNIEHADVSTALQIMTIAHLARPSGPLIERKIKEYKKCIENL